ncbi:GNAT family N-acetyltransferase [Paenibacillus bovis]|uniref:GNAT family N-acetyltransferase n=1 Tax=Paenibacillus bovis TaxID=1616788 RepID=UPI000760D241|nr:GNAT family protein [Paenibacillus bovis]
MNHTNKRVLESERLYLRAFTADDLDMYYPKLLNEEMRRLTGTHGLFTREGVARFIEESAADSSRIDLLIILKPEEQPIGEISLMDIDRINRNAHIRIAIFESANCGQGYGTEAMEIVLDYAFGNINLHRVELSVFSFNERAIRSYEKLGFRREGVQREVLYYDYEYHDAISMSILSHEFQQMRQLRKDLQRNQNSEQTRQIIDKRL